MSLNKTIYIKHNKQEISAEIILDLELDESGDYYIDNIEISGLYDEYEEEIEITEELEDKVWSYCEARLNKFVNQIEEKY